MKSHNIKLERYFAYDVESGKKTFEYRKNDRDYAVGDLIIFCNPETGDPWVQLRPYEIVYVLEHDDFETIPEGWCIFSIKKLVIE